jgi:hypothetical protein
MLVTTYLIWSHLILLPHWWMKEYNCVCQKKIVTSKLIFFISYFFQIIFFLSLSRSKLILMSFNYIFIFHSKTVNVLFKIPLVLLKNKNKILWFGTVNVGKYSQRIYLCCYETCEFDLLVCFAAQFMPVQIHKSTKWSAVKLF